MKRAGDLLRSFFEEVQFNRDSLTNGRMTANLFTSWAAAAKAVDISVAADHSRVRELEHKVLVIEAEHPGWVQLLQTKQSQLLEYVQRKFPELHIQGISFCLSREPISDISAISSSVQAIPMVLPAGQDSTQNVETVDTPAPDSGAPEKNEALYAPIKELRRVLQKRARE
jgi:hypothetical protein